MTKIRALKVLMEFSMPVLNATGVEQKGTMPLNGQT